MTNQNDQSKRQAPSQNPDQQKKSGQPQDQQNQQNQQDQKRTPQNPSRDGQQR